MERLMKSLVRSEYLNHSIKLEFQIEYNPTPEVKEYVQSFVWPYGAKSMIFRDEPYGLKRMVINSWKAENDKEFVFFFEDDIEVQAKYFVFALELMKAQPEILERNSNIFGIALTTPKYDEVNLIHSIWTPETNGNCIFLLQQPCSWGALYFPWKWREFLEYYKERLEISLNGKKEITVIPKTCIYEWHSSWKKYLMELFVIEGYMMIYPNLPKQESFSIHHHEKGEHFSNYLIRRRVIDYFYSPLASKSSADFVLEGIKRVNISSIPKFSFYHFPIKSIDEIKEFGRLIRRNLIIK